MLSFKGAGFAAFGQAKPVVTPFGQVAAVGVSSNPFMVSELLHDINNLCMSEKAQSVIIIDTWWVFFASNKGRQHVNI